MFKNLKTISPSIPLISFFILTLIFGLPPAFAKDVMVTGKVIDMRNNKPIEDAQIKIGDLSVETDTMGTFIFSAIKAKQEYKVEVVKPQYENFSKNVFIKYDRKEKKFNLGNLKISLIPPSAPEIIKPKGKVNSLRPTFEWKMEEDDWSIDSFEIEIDTKPTFASRNLVKKTIPGDSPNFTPQAFLQDNQSYHWRIRAIFKGGLETEWRGEIFEVPMKQPPGAPPTTTITQGKSDDIYPAWMPEGKSIVFQSNRGGLKEVFEIWKVTPGRGGFNKITSSVLGSLDLEPCSGPGAGNVTFVSNRIGKINNIWSAPTSHNTLITQRTNFQVPATSPSWSREGGIMAFSQKINNNLSYIWTIHVDGSNLTQLVVGENPVISPDGKEILFTSKRTGNYDIWKIDITGSNLMQITSATSDEIQPSWGHTGKYVVYVSNKSENQDLWAMNLSTGKTTQLTNNLADDVNPECSPVEEKIVFSSNRESSFNLYTITYKEE